MNYKVFLFWLFLVIMWNFRVPYASPLLDVVMAVILSFIGILANSILDDK
tara:strand:+ start:713 stop:862 length:150 start_codon:yes stop_codon:yes gene_type:complete